MKKLILNDMAEIFSGLSYRRYLDENGDNFKIIVQRSIKKDGELSDFEEVSLKTNIKDRYFTHKNDVLMKMTYPYDVVCVKQPNLIISDRIAIIRLKKGYNPEFIAHLLTNAHVKKQLKLIVPDLETQMKYGELLNTINEKIFEDLRQVDYDRHLKEAILNDLWGDDYER